MNNLKKTGWSGKHILSVLLVFTVSSSLYASGDLNTQVWTTNGSVRTSVVDGSTLYIGGTFTYAGPYTGNLAALDMVTGSVISGLPKVGGVVRTRVSDGAGGWYIGGNFTSIDGQPYFRLAHINADNTLDTGFQPNINNVVRSLALDGTTLYVGGHFTDIDGQGRDRLAAFDTATGNLTAWNPGAGNPVISLLVEGTTLYVGGSFTFIAGQARNRLASFDSTSGNLTSWNPNSNNVIWTLVSDGSTLYAGGQFSSISGSSRFRLASFDSTTGLLTPWNPVVNSNVYSLALTANRLYAGGTFTLVDGLTRNRIAAFDTTSGGMTSWDPNANATVNSIATQGTTVFAGGGFTDIGGQSRNSLAALDATLDSNNATTWNPVASGFVYTLATDVSTLYAGGAFNSVGGVERNRLAAIDLTTGMISSWNPDVTASGGNAGVHALLLDGNTLYVGGQFAQVGGVARNLIAAVDTATGLPTAWDPNASSTSFFQPGINAFLLDGTTLYAGGAFNAIGGFTRNNIAAIDTTTGNVTAWDPDITNGTIFMDGVYAMILDGTTLYAGGNFDTVAGIPRNNIVALDTSTGLPTPWNPDITGSNSYFDGVQSLEFDGETLYVGGSFDSAGGAARNFLAGIDLSGLATAFQPLITIPNPLFTSVQTLYLDGSTLYLGGNFTAVNGVTRNNLASLDVDAQALTAWDPNPTPSASAKVRTLNKQPETLYVGSDPGNGWRQLSVFDFLPPGADASPGSGTYSSTQLVALSCIDNSTSGCTKIRYSTDGSTPNTTSAVFTAPLSISSNTRLSFFSTDNLGIDGPLQTRDYVIDSEPPVTTASLTGGMYNGNQLITLSCADSNTGCNTIYYTDDGSTPGVSSMLYTGPIAVNTSLTLKISAVDIAGNAEPVKSETYQINGIPVVDAKSITFFTGHQMFGVLSGSDTDNEPLSYSIVSDPAQGAVSIVNQNTGLYQYIPNPGHNGADSFTYKANDGKTDSNIVTVNITIDSVAVPSSSSRNSGGCSLSSSAGSGPVLPLLLLLCVVWKIRGLRVVQVQGVQEE